MQKYAIDNLEEAWPLINGLDPHLIQDKVQIYYFDSQYEELKHRILLKPLYDVKVLRPICKTIGLHRTNLAEGYLKFSREVKSLHVWGGFDEYVILRYCSQCGIPVVTGSGCMTRLCNELSVDTVSLEQFEIILSPYVGGQRIVYYK